jgi:pilus assembly protein CpaC
MATVVSVLATLSLAFAASWPIQASAAKSTSKRMASSRTALPRLTLAIGDQHVFAVNGAIARVATANPDMVGINAVPPSGVVLTAMMPGTAMVSVWVEGRNLPVVQYLVSVSPRLPGAKDALGSDAAQTNVEVAGAALRLSGQLSSLESHEAAVAGLAASNGGGKGSGASGLFGALFGGGGSQSANSSVLDDTKSNFDVQVQLDVKVVEVSRGKLKSAGFYAGRFTGSADIGLGGPSVLSSFTSTTQSDGTQRRQINSGSGFLPIADAFNIFRWGANSLTVFSALENNGFAYTLAEPSLTAISGQTATFLAGGELPIPLRSGSGADATITVDYKKFGIRLSMTPTVLDAQRMMIHVAPEVSEIDESLSVTAGGLNIPGMRVRRTETTVALADGETFVISGLVNQKTSSAIDKFPFLGDIPILGAFFRSSRFSRDDQEMLMIITPHLVRPFAKEAKLPNLPGEALKDFDPGYLRFLFLENGKFTQPDSGFSR